MFSQIIISNFTSIFPIIFFVPILKIIIYFTIKEIFLFFFVKPSPSKFKSLFLPKSLNSFSLLLFDKSISSLNRTLIVLLICCNFGIHTKSLILYHILINDILMLFHLKNVVFHLSINKPCWSRKWFGLLISGILLKTL
jgi:hypothetical protein